MRDLQDALSLFSQVIQKPGVAGVCGVSDNDIKRLSSDTGISEGVAKGVSGVSGDTATPALKGVSGKVSPIKPSNNNDLEDAATPEAPRHRNIGQTSGDVCVSTLHDFEQAFAKFRAGQSQGQSHLRHDQAVWCAEIFLRDWGQLAAEFGWTADDLFARDGLACWLAENGTDLVRSLGPDCAVSEDGSRTYDRAGRCSWVRP